MVEPRTPTDKEIKAYAAHMIEAPEYKVLLKGIKHDVIRRWANEKDADERDALWHRMQAIGDFEMLVQTLAGDKQMDDRKAETARRKAGG